MRSRTTIADFISRSRDAIASVFAQVGTDTAQTVECESRVRPRIERFRALAKLLRDWLAADADEKLGSSGEIRGSNLTDNESARMSTSDSAVQGYCGAAVVDAAHQVIVEASAFGTGSEQELLMPLLDACANQRHAETIITADSG